MGTGKCVLITKKVDPNMVNFLRQKVPQFVLDKLQKIVDSGKPRPKSNKRSANNAEAEQEQELFVVGQTVEGY